MHKTPPSPDKANDPRFNGLVDWNFETERYEVNERWWAAKEAHEFIDSIWVTLEDLEWQGATNWNNVNSIDGSIIDAIHGGTFPTDSVYMEVARFTSAGGDEYYMLVNRRTLSSDSQDVVIHLVGQLGLTHFYDVYKDITYDAFGCGEVKFSAHFEPGQLRLFRIQPDSLPDDWCIGIRGDIDCNGSYCPNIGDLYYLINILFYGFHPCCEVECDVDGSGSINVADMTYLVDLLFFDGPAPLPCP